MAATMFAGCALSAALAAWTTNIWLGRAGKQQAELIRHMQIELRCLSYWSGRSAIADATFEFEHGRPELIRTVKSADPVLESWIPGLRTDLHTGVRTDVPLQGPDLNGLIHKSEWRWHPSSCSPTSYAWDYNVTMLRLLGRQRDNELRPVSPEFSSRR